MNKNKNEQSSVFPEFQLFHPMERIIKLARGFLTLLPGEADLSLSEHNKGAGPMLDTYQEELPFEPPFNTSGR